MSHSGKLQSGLLDRFSALLSTNDVPAARKLLQKNKALAHETDAFGQTPLHLASLKGELELVKYIVERCKVGVESCDRNKWTALHCATSGLSLQHVLVCSFLLSVNAQPTAQNLDGSTPLHYLVRMNPTDDRHLRELLANVEQMKSAVNIANKYGETPLHHSTSRGCLTCTQTLLRLGAVPQARSRSGDTPLLSAIRYSKAEQVKYLLRHGALLGNFHIGLVALDLAEQIGDSDIISIVEDALLTSKRTSPPDPAPPTRPAPPPAAAPIAGDIDWGSDADDEADGAGGFIVGDEDLDETPPATRGAAFGAKKRAFQCPLCARDVSQTPLYFFFPAPRAYLALSAAELQDTRLSADLCELPSGACYVRGLLGLVSGVTFGVWVQIEGAAFERYWERWSTPGRDADALVEGRLANDLPGYESTVGLRVFVRTQPPGKRPLVEMDRMSPRAVGHPLFAHVKKEVPKEELDRLLGSLRAVSLEANHSS